MSPENIFNEETRTKLKRIIEKRYHDFSTLYPRLKIQDLTDEQLYKILGEKQPIEKVLGKPETTTVYHLIRINFPEFQRQYPDADLFSLQSNQLERLVRGESPEKVLDLSQYPPLSKTQSFEELIGKYKALIPRKPGIGNHYAVRGQSKTPRLRTTSARRGFNPRTE